jgi:hypothetical protein
VPRNQNLHSQQSTRQTTFRRWHSLALGLPFFLLNYDLAPTVARFYFSILSHFILCDFECPIARSLVETNSLLRHWALPSSPAIRLFATAPLTVSSTITSATQGSAYLTVTPSPKRVPGDSSIAFFETLKGIFGASSGLQSHYQPLQEDQSIAKATASLFLL